MADIGLSWSRWDGQQCLRVDGAAPQATVVVWPAAVAHHGALPPMAGTWVRDGDGLCFIPRFSFVDGESYVVAVDGERCAPLERPPTAPQSPAAEVAAIFPSGAVVPRNVLRFYIWFTEPMTEGSAATHVGLVDAGGRELADALMPSEYELWGADRHRLTVLMDPARIKRGLVSNRAVGYPLVVGQTVRLVVGTEFPDARGVPLSRGAEHSYLVGPDEHRLVDPTRWRLDVPRAGTTDPLRVEFDRPLDHALLARCLRTCDPSGQPVGGRVEMGPGESAWLFRPRRAWAAAAHGLAVDPILEDLAGNSLERVFDRDLEEDPVGAPGRTVLRFRPRD